MDNILCVGGGGGEGITGEERGEVGRRGREKGEE